MTTDTTVQTKIHTDSILSYAEANSQAAKAMRDKLHGQIKKARDDAPTFLKRVLDITPEDALIDTRKVEFAVDTRELKLHHPSLNGSRTVHSFALSKICEYTGIPKDYLTRLVSAGEEHAWATKLAENTLNEHFSHHAEVNSRRLFRQIGTEVRGFLSDTYARLHPGMLATAFIESCQKYGLLPYGGHVADTQFVMRATLDRVIEPVKDEVLGIGVIFRESPFGDGASEISFQIERMFCTNKAVTESALRKVHIGGRAPRDAKDADEQYRMHSRTMAAEIQNAMDGLFSPGAINRLANSVKEAHAQKISSSQFDNFLKRYLNKGELETVKEHFRSADIANLPSGDTWWRASQALALYANTVEEKGDSSRAFEIQKAAGAAMSGFAKA